MAFGQTRDIMQRLVRRNISWYLVEQVAMEEYHLMVRRLGAVIVVESVVWFMKRALPMLVMVP